MDIVDTHKKEDAETLAEVVNTYFGMHYFYVVKSNGIPNKWIVRTVSESLGMEHIRVVSFIMGFNVAKSIYERR